MLGKVRPDRLAEFVLGRTGAPDDRVIQGPAYGEDTAAIDLGNTTLVINTDPISLAVDRLGTLGINIVCNDIAASGARPDWLSSALFLPEDDPGMLDAITAQLDTEASRRDVSIVGGHTEYSDALEVPLLVLTGLGQTDRFVPSGGATPGDAVVMTKAAGLEATAILATDFRHEVADQLSESTRRSAEAFYEEISVIPEAKILSTVATAMHDPTEGGMIDGLLEVAVASDVALEIEESAIPIREETVELCQIMDVNPLHVFASGSLLATVPEDAIDSGLEELNQAGIQASVIGTVLASDTPELRINNHRITEPVRDDMYGLWEQQTH